MRALVWGCAVVVACSGAPTRAPVERSAYPSGDPLVASAPPPMDAGAAAVPDAAPVPARRPIVLANATQLTVGHSHACALTSDHAVVCWGDNAVGQVGDATPGGTTPVALAVAQPVSGLPPMAQVAAGQGHTCGVAIDGDVYCWGTEDTDVAITSGGVAGKMELSGPGLGTPTKITLGLTGARVVALSTTSTHACAAYDDDVRCWRYPVRDGGPVVQRVAIKNVSSLALAHGKACAIADGAVTCWESAGAPSPVRIGSVRAVHVALGQMYACVTVETGDAQCWKSLVDSFWKHKPDRLVRWRGKRATRAIAIGDSPVCSLDEDGAVDCFWSDDQGLPDQAKERTWATRGDGPHPIAGIAGASELGLGLGRDAFAYGFGCVRQGGEVLCWGDNDSGQLGNGTFDDALTPLPVLVAR